MVGRVHAGQHAGVRFRNSGDPILNVSRPEGVDAQLQRDSIDLIGALNRRRLEIENDPEIATRIDSYEMAYRLQASAPELMDLKRKAPRHSSSTALTRPSRRMPAPVCSRGA